MAERLNDRYELHELLGSGGMGRVHRGFDTRLQRPVAIKILRGEKVADETARARLRAEAVIAGTLHHPGVAEVFDHDEDAASPDRDPFIVMQHVEGRPLAALLRDGPLPVPEVAGLLHGVADALAAAHRAGVVHRDLKPANIMITSAGRPVLVDFGIATSPDQEPLTETGTIIGTTEYLSPEQAMGRPASAASDVYALGVVAYQCLTGVSPFRRDGAVATALAQVGDDLPAWPDDVPEPLREVVTSMTAKDPDERPTAEQVAAVTERPWITGDVDPVTTLLPARTRRRRWTPARGPRSRYAAIGALAVVAAVALVLQNLGGSDTRKVPDLVGLTAAQAVDRAESAGLSVRRTVLDDPVAEKGMVVEQSPKPGASTTRDTMTIAVASGRMEVPADALVGKTLETARRLLEKRGFVVTTTEVTSTRTPGTVVAVDRSGRLPLGTVVIVSVARAPVITAPTTSTTTSGGTGAKKPGGKGGKKGKR